MRGIGKRFVYILRSVIVSLEFADETTAIALSQVRFRPSIREAPLHAAAEFRPLKSSQGSAQR
ncbi:MAG: hypothetical protein ACREMY_28580, partial [bacterium]